MGQQQLLLLVLSTVIVGASIVIGIGMFQDSAMNSNIDTVIQENVTIASKASEWFNKDVSLGGGGGDFTANGGVSLANLGYTTTAGNDFRDSTSVGIFLMQNIAATQLEILGSTAELDDTGQPRQVLTTLVMNANGTSTVTSQVQ